MKTKHHKMRYLLLLLLTMSVGVSFVKGVVEEGGFGGGHAAEEGHAGGEHVSIEDGFDGHTYGNRGVAVSSANSRGNYIAYLLIGDHYVQTTTQTVCLIHNVTDDMEQTIIETIPIVESFYTNLTNDEFLSNINETIEKMYNLQQIFMVNDGTSLCELYLVIFIMIALVILVGHWF